jgi:site-specific recombinase XerD
LKIYGETVETKNPERPRREYKIPNVLSKQEMKKLLGVLRNIKHRTMLTVIYACGLRRGELLNLVPGGIDSRRGSNSLLRCIGCGTVMRRICWRKELLGHKSSRTTEIYTHVSARSIGKIRSTFEAL